MKMDMKNALQSSRTIALQDGDAIRFHRLLDDSRNFLRHYC